MNKYIYTFQLERYMTINIIYVFKPLRHYELFLILWTWYWWKSVRYNMRFVAPTTIGKC